jgi:hypothetical protein
VKVVSPTSALDNLGPFGVGLMIAVLVVFGVTASLLFLYRWRLRRDYTHGVRGHAAIAEVRPVPKWLHYSVTAAPTESVVIATAQVPRGMTTNQSFPLGTFAVGQIVPVVQRPGDLSKIRVDVPGQAPSLRDVYNYLYLAVAAVAGIAYLVLR